MRILAATASLFVSLSALSAPAYADILIENVNGLTLDAKGEVETFSAVLVGDDGRVEQVYSRKEKRPGKVDYQLDGKGRVMMPGLIDSHVELMELGLALLKSKAGFEAAPTGEPRPEDRDVALADVQRLLLSRGITTVADMGTTIEDWQTYRRAGDLGMLSIRIVAYAEGTRDMALIGGPRPTPWLYNDRLKLNGVVLTLDGVAEIHEAWLKAPYADTPGNSGKARITEAQLRNQMSRGAIDNFQIALRAHGDAASSAALDAIEELARTYSGDRRWRIEGLDQLDAVDLARFGAHGAVASMRPRRLGDLSTKAAALLGPERLASIHRWRSLTDGGITLAFGSSSRSEAPAPFAAMATAITRQERDALSFGGWQPQERLTREEALAAFTAGGAHAVFAEGRLGRIAKGQRADFILVDRDPLLSSPHELRDMQVLQTWVGGKLVYDAQKVEPEKPLTGR